MSPLGILIQVVAASSKERYQFRNIREVQPDHIAVNGHFSDVGSSVFCPQLAHLFFDQRFFTLIDNAVSEAMNKVLKVEFIYQNKFETLEELELQLAEYIYWYNHIRIHGSLGYISPVEYRDRTSLELIA